VKRGERREDAAQRELMEEVGYKAGNLQFLATIRPFTKYLRVSSHVFLATQLQPHRLAGDEKHVIGTVSFSRDRLREKIFSGEVSDARVVAALALIS
jgi:8-oxo-dGTP pyrophosphatase MutT (NUDIX family)